MNNANWNRSIYRFTWLAILGIIFCFVIVSACILALLRPEAFQGMGRALSFPAASANSSLANPNVSKPNEQAIQPTATAQAPVITVASPLTILFAKGQDGGQISKDMITGNQFTVTGSGQAAGKRFSDAFYVYTDRFGNTVKPQLTPAYATLHIDGKPAKAFLEEVPAYNPSHTYKVKLKVWNGTPLTVGIPDDNLSDNTGALMILFS
ncbi:hypothetical protein [Ktedonospora formicarum]|uniref:Uncharacterized protein n=1 Tax=Ktedonospora formicarum TaxID=2778364 RepID=A0A8J3I9D7_9CHLR|nr:hypothetical protein [Ktedonospora formicarum]GHO48412.1 hypothetical protein KSX_65750 [Ktedonospora formicarum]